MLPISAITPFTFQDFLGYTACIIWFGGCNFRCPYCHNAEFLTDKFPIMEEKKVFDFLESRKGLLDGVVLSGGECTLAKDLFTFVQKIKKMGFKVKIDTNGTNPEIIKRFLKNNLIDSVAMDFKATEDKFNFISKNKNYDKFSETLNFLIKKNFPLEVRTTVHTKLLQEDDINKIIKDLDNRNYKGVYYIQNFKDENCKTLEDLEKQERILDKDKLTKPKNFKLGFRNFW